MNWTDMTWSYAFGNLIARGQVPYRDFIYQIGPLPLLVDALVQHVCGPYYAVTVAIGILLRWLKLVVDYHLFRFAVSSGMAVALAAGLSLATLRTMNHPCTWTYLLIHTVGLCWLAGGRAQPSRRWAWSMLAGIALALLLTVRQSNAIVALAGTSLALAVLTVREGWGFVRSVAVPFVGGWAGTLVLTALGLAAVGALGPCMQQLFVDAGAKKTLGGPGFYLNQLVLGGIFDGGTLLLCNVLPLLLLAPLCRPIAAGRTPVLLVLVLAGMLLAGQLARLASLVWDEPPQHGLYLLATCDLPRVALGLLLLLLLVGPRNHHWLAVDRPTLTLVLATALSGGLAYLLSFPGRIYTDKIDLGFWLLWVLLFVSPALPALRATLLAGVALLALQAGIGLVGQDPARDGWWGGPCAVQPEQVAIPQLRGVRLSRLKAAVLTALRTHIQPGDRCFIYGSAPALYAVLECRNPTRLHSLYFDFYTATDAAELIRQLRAEPPEWLIGARMPGLGEHGTPVLEIGEDESPLFVGPHRLERCLLVHRAVRELLHEYELVYPLPGDRPLPGATDPGVERDVDRVDDLQLYRRRQLPLPRLPP